MTLRPLMNSRANVVLIITAADDQTDSNRIINQEKKGSLQRGFPFTEARRSFPSAGEIFKQIVT